MLAEMISRLEVVGNKRPPRGNSRTPGAPAHALGPGLQHVQFWSFRKKQGCRKDFQPLPISALRLCWPDTIEDLRNFGVRIHQGSPEDAAGRRLYRCGSDPNSADGSTKRSVRPARPIDPVRSLRTLSRRQQPFCPSRSVLRKTIARYVAKLTASLCQETRTPGSRCQAPRSSCSVRSITGCRPIRIGTARPVPRREAPDAAAERQDREGGFPGLASR